MRVLRVMTSGGSTRGPRYVAFNDNDRIYFVPVNDIFHIQHIPFPAQLQPLGDLQSTA